MSSSSSPPPPPATSRHLLVFPYPAQGHMLPLLDLTHFLASNGGFTITLIITPKNLPIINPLLQTHPNSIQPLILPFPPHPDLPAGVEHVSHIGNHGNFPITTALRRLHDPILHWFNSHPSPPVAVISDFFLGWTERLAARLRIPRLVFYSSGAFAVDLIHSCWVQIKTHRFRSSDLIQFNEIPNSPLFRKDQLPSLARLYEDSDPNWELLRDDGLANSSSWGCIFNTFECLEREYLTHLRKSKWDGRVFGVGPLNLIGHPIKETSSSSSSSSTEVLKWLDKCPNGSVVYVCFGSQKQLNQPQIEALASGLENSKIRFVWVVRTFRRTGCGCDGIPTGFEDRVSGRGFLVKGWAPQVAILNHGAVGGFLSHCGWNSVLESLAAGVVILGWPMEADQFVNAKLVVEEMGVAVRVCEGAEAVPDSEELGKVIAECLAGDSPEKMKANAMKREAVEAVGTNGSSWKDMQDLVNKLNHV